MKDYDKPTITELGKLSVQTLVASGGSKGGGIKGSKGSKGSTGT